MTRLTSLPCDGLHGEVSIPGDKSISHRALMLGGLAVGETRIEGLLEGEDVLATAAAMRALGAEIERREEGPEEQPVWHAWGRGVGGLQEPEEVLDLGNSGTGARLLLGLLASHPMTAVVTGDASLRSRPMARVTEPLRQVGAQFYARQGGRLPLTVVGTAEPMAPVYELPVASAQIKSALLLAGLAARGRTEIVEPEACRDHSERMLRHFGAELDIVIEDGKRRIHLTGQPELEGRAIQVPRDPSSAAFPLVAALITPNAELLLPAIGLNPTRTGLLTTLREMGADITLENEREEGGEPVADLRARSSQLTGVRVPGERAASMIDEYPILAMAAACAEGETFMEGLAELRVKESDRLAIVAQGLEACGVDLKEGEDSLLVRGCGGASGKRPRGGATIATHLDHRIAMSFLVLGLASETPVSVDDAGPIATSFPGFQSLMTALGAQFRAE